MCSDWYTERVSHDSYLRKHDHRTEYEKDKTNVIHSFAFRRLQGKFQMITPSESDFHRTRLTHSIEVASIAKNIFLNILDREKKRDKNKEKLDWLNQQKSDDITSLLETISLMHDIGHSAFGHAGEVALNYMMRNHGGFESNAETLNIYKYKGLTKRCLLGILKYPLPYSHLRPTEQSKHHDKNRLIDHENWKPPKCYYDEDQKIVEEILDKLLENDKKEFKDKESEPSHKESGKTKYKSFDCSIMEIADDIAYSTHDLEDALFYKLVAPEKIEGKLEQYVKELDQSGKDMFKEFYFVIKDKIDNRHEIRKQIGNLVHYFLIHTNIQVQDTFEEPLLKYKVKLDKEVLDIINSLKETIDKNVIHLQEVQSIIHGGMLVLMQLFEAIESNPSELLPPMDILKYKKHDDESDKKRIICSYIAGMTDDYAYRMHARLYGHNTRNMFEKL